jgi:signal peptidase I
MLGEFYPNRALPKVRENVEMIVVAFAVAMAFRTYIIQPFKIPTGSMQPTLYGITAVPQTGRATRDIFPLNIVGMVLWGDRYVEVRAKAGGVVERGPRTDEGTLFMVGNVPHLIRLGNSPEESMAVHVRPGDRVARGQLLASGRVRLGDHLFVDKIRYNFTKPRRGDVIVFGTENVNHPQVRPDTFYIKRLAALPNETVSIYPPYLIVDGERITEPRPFTTLLEDVRYNGYTLAHRQPGLNGYLEDVEDVRTLGPREYLPLGDNTAFSLDGRYFGPVTDRSIVGPAVVVYWPFTKRWGFVR